MKENKPNQNSQPEDYKISKTEKVNKEDELSPEVKAYSVLYDTYAGLKKSQNEEPGTYQDWFDDIQHEKESNTNIITDVDEIEISLEYIDKLKKELDQRMRIMAQRIIKHEKPEDNQTSTNEYEFVEESSDLISHLLEMLYENYSKIMHEQGKELEGYPEWSDRVLGNYNVYLDEIRDRLLDIERNEKDTKKRITSIANGMIEDEKLGK